MHSGWRVLTKNSGWVEGNERERETLMDRDGQEAAEVLSMLLLFSVIAFSFLCFTRDRWWLKHMGHICKALYKAILLCPQLCLQRYCCWRFHLAQNTDSDVVLATKLRFLRAALQTAGAMWWFYIYSHTHTCTVGAKSHTENLVFL